VFAKKYFPGWKQAVKPPKQAIGSDQTDAQTRPNPKIGNHLQKPRDCPQNNQPELPLENHNIYIGICKFLWASENFINITTTTIITMITIIK
jgi:hypothetical protein